MKLLEVLNELGIGRLNDCIEILSITECSKGWKILAYNRENGEKIRLTFEKF
jgi:hypothetical protein